MKATGYGAENGPVGDMFKLKLVSADDVSKSNEHAKARPAYGGGVDAVALGNNFTALKGMPTSTSQECQLVAQAIEEMVAAGVWCPVEIVIARPFIEHLMLSAVVAVAGRDTGATLFGPADMSANLMFKPVPAQCYTILVSDTTRVCFRRQISANTSVKTIEGESAPSPTAPTAPTTSPI
jgi:hypothetical protein